MSSYRRGNRGELHLGAGKTIASRHPMPPDKLGMPTVQGRSLPEILMIGTEEDKRGYGDDASDEKANPWNVYYSGMNFAN